MTVEIHVIPGRTISRDIFLMTHPRYSIALDGYVRGRPFFVEPPRGPFRNFNHHEAVDRSCTCATCEQVRRGVLLGLYELYERGGEPHAHVWVNDCDQDVCLATWILLNPDRATETAVLALTQAEDVLDMTGGALLESFEGAALEAQMRWVFEPYTSKRRELTDMKGPEMRAIIDAVHERIDAHLAGEGEALSALGTYQSIGGGPGWQLVEIDHQHARRKMVEDGINAAVELYARNKDRFVYALWRRSEYIVSFPLPEILRALNRAEGLGPDDMLPAWGGATNIGGSPRGVASKLAPEEVERIVNEVLAEQGITEG